MFRISRGESGFDADSIGEARGMLAGEPPGRYGVDEIRAEPFASGHTSRQWGHLIREFDGGIAEEPHPWPDASGQWGRKQGRS
ncbi:MAG: hypothetical protein ACLQIB_07185 [Isosphaeraceae bacterium]